MTKDQERASAAWVDISSVKNQSYEMKYSSLAKKFPALVLTNGLGQALAFLRAKGKDSRGRDRPEFQNLYRHISVWVSNQIYNAANDDKLLERLIGGVPGADCDSNAYRRATTETLAFITWLKRFAEAELRSEV
jgi:CRISPR-associated protein Cmr5